MNRQDTNQRTSADQVELLYVGRRNTMHFKPMSTKNRYIANKGGSVFAFPDDVAFLLSQHDPAVGSLFVIADHTQTDVEAPAIVPAADNLGNRAPRQPKPSKRLDAEAADVLPAEER